MATIKPEHTKTVQQMYVAYYGRPGDSAGIEYWAGRLAENNGAMSAMIDAFGSSKEYRDGIGSQPTVEKVTLLYQQMFNRQPEQTGLDYWVNKIDSGARSLASVALAIADGAQNQDAVALDNKIQSADYFTARVDETGVSYQARDIPAAHCGRD